MQTHQVQVEALLQVGEAYGQFKPVSVQTGLQTQGWMSFQRDPFWQEGGKFFQVKGGGGER
ncbi:MAG: hypothetical protein BWY72_01983 [Bacteroidetes bacterium ADurb.Bin416]|nr:MAG: hypothetical protein BWY72_01983 [Bacteroidetes bacterium ADurb.Bin416]